MPDWRKLVGRKKKALKLHKVLETNLYQAGVDIPTTPASTVVSTPSIENSSTISSEWKTTSVVSTDENRGTQANTSIILDDEVSADVGTAVLTGLSILSDGLTILSNPDSTDFDLDICFVHGLNGDAGRSWVHPATGFFWPLQLTRDIPTVRILLFGFDALIEPSVGSKQIRLPGVARKLLQDLVNHRSRQNEISRPLIFIGHSLGGLVIKKCLVEAERSPRNGREEIYRATRSALFFGTPNAGSDVTKAKRVQLLETVARAAFTEVPPKIRSLLQLHSDDLLDLGEHFREIELCRKSMLLIYTFYETRNLPGLGRRVVDEYSAKVMASEEESLPIQADHIGMVKFMSESDGNYNLVSGILERLRNRKPPPAIILPSKGLRGSIMSKNAAVLISEYDTRAGDNPANFWSFGQVADNSRVRQYYEIPLERKINRFVGQEDILLKLDHMFRRLWESEIPEPCIVTLAGMGGIGKTQLALEYCRRTYYRTENSFHDVFWLNASSEETLTTGFVKLSTLFAPAEQAFGDTAERVAFVLATFSAWDYRYLLVLDNYDDPTFAKVLQYLPKTSPCAILFTSRLLEAGEEFGEMITVPLMNRQDAVDVLRSRRRPSGPSDQHFDDDIDDVIKLLGNLPLALDQAGAYMASGGGQMSLKTFIQHFQTRKKTVLETTPGFWKYTAVDDSEIKTAGLSILTTWELSLEKLGLNPSDHAMKTHFLTLMAFLDTDRISRFFFHSHWRFRSECPVCSQGNHWIEIFNSTSQEFDINRYRDVVVEMANLSLIRHLSEDVSGHSFVVSLHPLIRDWAQFRIDESQQQEMAKEASYVVADLLVDYRSGGGVTDVFRIVPKSPLVDDWDYAALLRETMTEIIAHMDRCVEHWKRLRITSMTTTLKDGDIFVAEYIFGETYASAADMDKSCELMERAYHTAVRAHGDEHDYSLSANAVICSLRVRQGRGVEVRTRLEALARPRGSHGIARERCILVSCWLAQVHNGEGREQAAKELAKSVVTSFESMDLTRDFELKVIITNLLGTTLESLGLQEEAQSVWRHTITYYKEHPPLDSKQSRSSVPLRSLEISLAAQLLSSYERNNLTELLKEAELILAGLDETSLDPGNPMDQSSLKGLHGLVHAAHGRWRQAAEMSDFSYRYYLEVLGPAHPLTVNRLCNLVKQLLHADAKDHTRPLQTINDVVRQAEKLHGSSHKKVVDLQNTVANTLYSARHYNLALDIYQDIYQKVTQASPMSPSRVALAENNLANNLFHLATRSGSDTERMVSLYQSLVERSDADAGDSPIILKKRVQTRRNLGFMYRQLRQYKQATLAYEEALIKQLDIDGSEGPDTWPIQYAKALCLRFGNEKLKAIDVLEKLYEAQLSVLGEYHADVVATVIQLAHCYCAKIEVPGACDKARKWYEWLLQVRLREASGMLSADVAEAHRWIGELHSKMGQHVEAAGHLETACQWSRPIRGQALLDDLISLGLEYFSSGAYDKQKVVNIERLGVVQEHKGAQSDEMAVVLSTLALNEENLKDPKNSLKYRVEERAVRKSLREAATDRMIICLSSIARLSEDTADFALRQSALTELLEIRTSPDGSDNSQTIPLLTGLATTAVQLKNWDASIEYSERAIEYYRLPGHQVDRMLIGAELSMSQGLVGRCEYARAESHAARGMQLCIDFDGESAMGTMRARYRLAVTLFKQSKYQEAAQNFEQCLPIIKEVDGFAPYWKNLWLDNVRFAEGALVTCKTEMGAVTT